jgi:hypothetical protein
MRQLLAQVRSDALQSLVYRPLRNAQPLRNRPLGETFQQMPRGDLSVGWTEALQRLPQGAGEYAHRERLLRGRVFALYLFACLLVAGRVALALGGRPNAVAEAFQVLSNHAHAPLIERAAAVGVVGRLGAAGGVGSLVVEFLVPVAGVGARGDVGAALGDAVVNGALQFWGQVAQQAVERVARHAAPTPPCEAVGYQRTP